jgi:hypothetical protein
LLAASTHPLAAFKESTKICKAVPSPKHPKATKIPRQQKLTMGQSAIPTTHMEIIVYAKKPCSGAERFSVEAAGLAGWNARQIDCWQLVKLPHPAQSSHNRKNGQCHWCDASFDEGL